MKAPPQKMGNSRGVVIPKPAIAQLGLVDMVDIVVEADRIVITRPRIVREGWAEAAAIIGKEPLVDEDRDWIDAPLSADTDAESTW